MIDLNALLLCDTYKTTHFNQYPKGLEYLVSYYVPRKSMLKTIDKQVFFGLQAFIQEFLVDYFKWNFFDKEINTLIKEYKQYMTVQLGEGVIDKFADNIRKLHKLGYLPLRIRALPEGSLVNMGIPCIELTNTNKNFAWLVQWVECILQTELWKISNHATIGREYLKLTKEFYKKTVDDDVDPRMACSDFGFRGMSCTNEAIRCSSAFLLSFNKTSTVPALKYIDHYYDANVKDSHVGMGAVSTEHSVMSANFAVDGNEITFVKRLLTELYPNTSFSMVSDTYDYWNMVDNIIPACKNEILNHNGKLLVRPDSGDQVSTVVNTICKLWDTFGGYTNIKGYKVLNPHIGVILGDGATLRVVRLIWESLETKGFASNNVVFGVGAFPFSGIFDNEKLVVNTRDTFGVAMKATFAVINGKSIPIYKDPKTDTDHLKKSHKGCVKVVKNLDGSYISIDGFDGLIPDNETELRVVFENGIMHNRETFDVIRDRVNKGV